MSERKGVEFTFTNEFKEIFTESTQKTLYFMGYFWYNNVTYQKERTLAYFHLISQR